jgi:uncharacterized protein YndB with AHSA1/START domain
VRIEHELTIARPPSEVFAYLTDPAVLPEWQATAEEARLESETMGKGARLVEVRKFLGRRMESQMEVVDYEPDRRFALKVDSGPIPFVASHVLEPTNGGTRLRFVLEGEPGGFLRLADPLAERQARRQVESDFAALKDIVEARAVPGGTA